MRIREIVIPWPPLSLTSYHPGENMALYARTAIIRQVNLRGNNIQLSVEYEGQLFSGSFQVPDKYRERVKEVLSQAIGITLNEAGEQYID